MTAVVNICKTNKHADASQFLGLLTIPQSFSRHCGGGYERIKIFIWSLSIYFAKATLTKTCAVP